MGGSEQVVESSIVRYRVLGEYLGIRTGDNNLYLFYKPSYIGMFVKSHSGAGAALVIIGVLFLVFGYGLYQFETVPIGLNFLRLVGSILLVFGIFFFIIGIVLFFWKERFLLIETHGGTRIWFKNPGITDRDIGAIFSQFAEEYKEKTETEKINVKLSS